MYKDDIKLFNEIIDKNNIDLNAIEYLDSSILIAAVHAEKLNVVTEIIRRTGKRLINKAPVGGDTPIILAALLGNKPITQYLLEHGADVTIQNYEGKAALDYASDPEIKKMLEEALKSVTEKK